MPKRSNDFQHLVKVIHDAISKVEGATVTESAMLPEPDGTLREVDILLERRVADVPICLAIECRDRSRKSDVDWIDGLIGKYRNLKVDKIVAVCRKGFSDAAATKAAANNIELRVLAECLTHEWSNEFIPLGMAMFEFNPELRTVEITLDPPQAKGIEPTSIIDCGEAFNTQRTLEQFVFACYFEKIVPQIKHQVESEFLSKGPPLADLTRSWEFKVPVNVEDYWVIAKTGTRHRIAHMIFIVAAQSHADISQVKHSQYGTTALATEGHMNVGPETYKVSVVQIAGQNSLTATFTKVIPK